MSPLLSVHDLEVRFPIRGGLLSRIQGHVSAVRGVSFDVKRGTTLGIVGESGCGKTTLGLALLGLVSASNGHVHFEEEDMLLLSKKKLRQVLARMQMVFQDPMSSLNPRMTVSQIVADPLYVHGIGNEAERRDRVRFLLEKVGLTAEHGRRYPHELSGGQRQRVGIARALALSPALIIADEPVSALDVSVQAQIINLLMDLQQEFGLSYIIISHDLAIVEHISDQVAVMYLGRIVEHGSWQQVYHQPAHPYTQKLLAAVPVPDPNVQMPPPSAHEDLPSPISPPSGCAFHMRCPYRLGVCSEQQPILRDIGEGHKVACHLNDIPRPVNSVSRSSN